MATVVEFPCSPCCGGGCDCLDLPDTLVATVSMECATGSGEFELTRTDPEECEWFGEWEHHLGTGSITLAYADGEWTITLECFAGTTMPPTVEADACSPVDLLFTVTGDPTFCCSFGGTTFTIHVTE